MCDHGGPRQSPKISQDTPQIAAFSFVHSLISVFLCPLSNWPNCRRSSESITPLLGRLDSTSFLYPFTLFIRLDLPLSSLSISLFPLHIHPARDFNQCSDLRLGEIVIQTVGQTRINLKTIFIWGKRNLSTYLPYQFIATLTHLKFV